MSDVIFYHLTDTPLERALPQLLARALAQGWRIELRGRDAARIDWLDRALWLGQDDGFVPHGVAGGPHDALQPVLLTQAPVTPPRDCLMTFDSADVAADEARLAARVCILFDGHDDAAKTAARAQWRALTNAGLGARYWAQQDGGWVMKHER